MSSHAAFSILCYLFSTCIILVNSVADIGRFGLCMRDGTDGEQCYFCGMLLLWSDDWIYGQCYSYRSMDQMVNGVLV